MGDGRKKSDFSLEKGVTNKQRKEARMARMVMVMNQHELMLPSKTQMAIYENIYRLMYVHGLVYVHI
jgi:hypothetical protein